MAINSTIYSYLHGNVFVSPKVNKYGIANQCFASIACTGITHSFHTHDDSTRKQGKTKRMRAPWPERRRAARRGRLHSICGYARPLRRVGRIGRDVVCLAGSAGVDLVGVSLCSARTGSVLRSFLQAAEPKHTPV